MKFLFEIMPLYETDLQDIIKNAKYTPSKKEAKLSHRLKLTKNCSYTNIGYCLVGFQRLMSQAIWPD